MDSCVQYPVFCLYKYFKKKVLSLIKNGINNKMLALLAVNDIKTLDDFAGLATFDLIDKEEGIFKELDIEEKIVNNIPHKLYQSRFRIHLIRIFNNKFVNSVPTKSP